MAPIVREKTGLGLHDYLKTRLFDKIGIDADNLRWTRMPDGMEVGGGGLLATTEDNLRLMKLYADGGVWEGERILAEDYVKLATTLQNESATEEAVNPPAKDNFVGYGYQIWMCRPKGVYRADGAMGQFTIVVPDKDIIIAITENAAGGHWAQKTLDTMWEFLDRIPNSEALPENNEAAAKLKRRLSSLALPSEPFAPFGFRRSMIDNTSWNVMSGSLYLGDMMRIFMSGAKPAGGISQFGFKFREDSCEINITRDGVQEVLIAAIDGSRRRNILEGAQMMLSASWPNDKALRLVIRNVEGCHKKILNFTFNGTACKITEEGMTMFMGRPAEPVIAAFN